MVDACLVSMPYGPIAGPSLGLGLLQSALRRDGISTTTVYANILWCEAIGLHQYDLGHHLPHLFGDWIFGRVAFPEFRPDCDNYLERIFQPATLERLGVTRRDVPEFIAAMCEEAARFINDTAHQLIDYEPWFVGCSSTFVGHVSSLALLRRVKALNPQIVTVMGGANCEAVMGLTTHEQFPWVDYVVSGDADTIIVDLARGIERFGFDIPLAEVPYGVIAPVHRNNGYQGLRATPPRAIARSLDELPVPSYDEYFSALKAAPTLSYIVRPGLPVEGSRGCWWGEREQCAFCGNSDESRAYRTKASRRLLEEMNELRAHHGLDNFGFVDMILNPAAFRDFLPEMEKDDRSWVLSFETTPSISAEQVGIMARAGVTCVQPGVESLDPGVLTLLNKGSKAWRNVRFLRWCRHYGIYASWLLLADIPGEDEGWYARTAQILPLIHHLQPPRAINPIILSRFSAYHKDSAAYDLSLSPASAYSCIYPLAEERLLELCYFFENVGSPESHDPERIKKMNKEKQTLIDAVSEWIRLFESDALPMMEARDTGTEIIIKDTRSVALEETLTLVGLEREIYSACEDGSTTESIYSGFCNRGATVSEVEDTIQRLLARRLLLFLDDHLLALGIPKPVAAIPRYPRYPYGSIDRVLYEALIAARRMTGRT